MTLELSVYVYIYWIEGIITKSMKWSVLSHIMYISKDSSRKYVCSECLKFKFMTTNIYWNYLTYEVLLDCFYEYLYNTPIFAQSSLRQGTK